MVKYTAKRLLQSLITVLVVATIVFLLMRMLPTDYYFTEDQVMKLTEEQKNAQLEAAGLLDPMGTAAGPFLWAASAVGLRYIPQNSERRSCS